MRIGLVACAAKKQPGSWPAKDLYTSQLFRKAFSYSIKHCEKTFILSAKYGLLNPDQVIECYDSTLKTISEPARILWARKIYLDLLANIKPGDDIFWFAGIHYRKTLILMLSENNHFEPVKGLGIGSQMKWYMENL
jgi:hypothetical protein